MLVTKKLNLTSDESEPAAPTLPAVPEVSPPLAVDPAFEGLPPTALFAPATAVPAPLEPAVAGPAPALPDPGAPALPAPAPLLLGKVASEPLPHAVVPTKSSRQSGKVDNRAVLLMLTGNVSGP